MKTPYVPYIGITDFTSFDQVEQMLAVFKANLNGKKRRLHVGVMMSRNSLLRQPKEYEWEAPIIDPDGYRAIFASDETYNCIHYADPKWREDAELEKHLYQAIMCGGTGIHALQLDLAWPDGLAISNAVISSRKNIDVILQVSGKILQEHPDHLMDRLGNYDGLIQCVLLDESRGKGRPLNAAALIPFIKAIRHSFPFLGIAVAGGNGPTTAHLIAPIQQAIPGVGTDAQGKIRPSGSIQDPIDLGMCTTYLIENLKIAR